MKLIGFMMLGCLLISGTTSADWLKAMQAYEQQDYATAKAEFVKLIPLGNETAAFNLGAMWYQGEGVEADPVKAMAYFMLADELGHEQASDILLRLQAQASEASLMQARTQYQQWLALVEVPAKRVYQLEESQEYPEPVRRVNPRYPLEAAQRGLFGYVNVRFLVDETGRVQVVDTIDAYPKNVFERSAVQAVKRWRYQPSEQKHVMRVQLSYSLEGVSIKPMRLEEIIDEHRLWDYAVAGSPSHQLVLGTLLRLAEIQSHNNLSVDKSLPLATGPDFSVFEPRSRLRAGFDGFFGQATVRVDETGTITEQLSATIAAESDITDLVGLSLSGKVEHDVYHIYRTADMRSRRPGVSATFEVPRTLTARFWWEQAARNGNRDAQRMMSAYDEHWEAYLLAEQDAEIMAWKATRMILEGQKEAGGKLLEQAIAQNHAIAKALKKQLL